MFQAVRSKQTTPQISPNSNWSNFSTFQRLAILAVALFTLAGCQSKRLSPASKKPLTPASRASTTARVSGELPPPPIRQMLSRERRQAAEQFLKKAEAQLDLEKPGSFKKIGDVLNAIRSLEDGQLKADIPLFLDRHLLVSKPNSFDTTLSWLRRAHLFKHLSSPVPKWFEQKKRRIEREHLRTYHPHREKLPLQIVDSHTRKLYQLYELLSPTGKAIAERMINLLDISLRKHPTAYLHSYIQNMRKRSADKLVDYMSRLRFELDTAFTDPSKHSHLQGKLLELKKVMNEASSFVRVPFKRRPFFSTEYQWEYHRGSGETKEEWVVYGDIAKHSEHYSFVTLKDKTNQRRMIYVKFDKFLDAVKNGGVDRLLETAAANFKLETNREAVRNLVQFNIADFDTVLYMRAFPDHYDSGVAGCLVGSMICAAAYHHRTGGKTAINPIIFSSNPISALERQTDRGIKQAKEKSGKIAVVYDLYCHGSVSSLYFGGQLYPFQLGAIVKRHSDVIFNINTVACHGGGLRKGLQAYSGPEEQLSKNLVAFMMAKPDALNYFGSTGAAGAFFTARDPALTLPHPYLVFIDGLFDKERVRTSGAAMRRSDIETKLIFVTDAELLFFEYLIGDLNSQDRLPAANEKVLAYPPSALPPTHLA